jgi:hypothetical protein
MHQHDINYYDVVRHHENVCHNDFTYHQPNYCAPECDCGCRQQVQVPIAPMPVPMPMPIAGLNFGLQIPGRGRRRFGW